MLVKFRNEKQFTEIQKKNEKKTFVSNFDSGQKMKS